MSTLISFRDTLTRIVPWWLRRRNAKALLYAIGVQLDSLADSAVEAVKREYAIGSGDSLALLGRERRIRRGPAESEVNYAARLRPWLDDHHTRGGPYALLRQVAGFYAESTTGGGGALIDGGDVLTDDFGDVLTDGAASTRTLTLRYWSGVVYTQSPEGLVTRTVLPGPYDPDSEHWARWWLYIEWPSTLETDGVWDDPGFWDDGGVWDSNLTVAEVESIRLVPTEWNNAHSKGEVVVYNLTPDELWDDPVELWDDPGLWSDSIFISVPLQQ